MAVAKRSAASENVSSTPTVCEECSEAQREPIVWSQGAGVVRVGNGFVRIVGCKRHRTLLVEIVTVARTLMDTVAAMDETEPDEP